MKRLLRQKRLTLVLDLDQTLIHASVDPTIKDWLDSQETKEANGINTKVIDFDEPIKEIPN